MSKHKKKKNTGRTVLIVLLALVIIAVIAAFAIFNKIKNFDESVDASSTKVVDFEIPKGASTQKIANLLAEAGLIENPTIFKFKAKFNNLDGKFQAGEYELSPSMGMAEIMTKIQDGRRETVRFTIKEGLSIKQIAAVLEEQGLCTKADFYKSLEEDEFDYWFVPLLEEKFEEPTGEVSKRANRFEGFLYPETYEVYVGASARNIINKMLGQFDKVFGDDLKTAFEKQDLSLQEILTIASLIEREIVVDEERPLCSSVIYNRLNTNATAHKLQIDATVLYCLGNPEGKVRVLYKDLEIDNPYNTYAYAGLPPGPICCPGLPCIEAALNPADTDYLYYVVSNKDKSTHKFTKSYNEHVSNSNDYKNSL